MSHISGIDVDLVCLSYNNCIHALPRCWAILLDIGYIQIILFQETLIL